MPSFTTTIVGSLLAAGVFANSLQIRDTDNCPGVNFVQTNSKGCCVGGTIDQPYLSVCDGWPICKGPTTTTWIATPISCATIVTDGPNYDSEISSARASLEASGTHLVTPLSSGVAQTTTASPGQSGSGSSAAATKTGSSSSTATAVTGSGSTMDATSSGAAAAATTSEGAAAELTVRMGLTGGALLAFAAAML
ncbi:hypothetical protein F4781DRAFT_437954 [Annulohypoxylon bovei var. microspora]|nr:hypothetical protein F4781DRAFT_437954 [Annulohypoxylon bovei var. microspora]